MNLNDIFMNEYNKNNESMIMSQLTASTSHIVRRIVIFFVVWCIYTLQYGFGYCTNMKYAHPHNVFFR